MVVMVVTDRFH